MRRKWIAYLILMAILVIPMMAAAADWPQVNYDINYSRNSPQTVIGKSNVASPR